MERSVFPIQVFACFLRFWEERADYEENAYNPVVVIIVGAANKGENPGHKQNKNRNEKQQARDSIFFQ